MSFDGHGSTYAKFHDALRHKGSDIYKVHVPTRKIVRLTEQAFTPNTGAADWSKTPLPSWGVYNLGPCPLPGGKLAFVSDRNAFKATNPGYAPNALALQLFVMDDDGKNVECIGHLNLGMALHPVILKDGRIMFSSLESQGLRSHHLWGVWSIHPDGTQLGAAVQRLRDRQRHRRLDPLPDAALRRQHRRRVVLQPQQLRLRHLLQVPVQRPEGLCRRSGRATSRTRATRSCGTAGTTTAGASTSVPVQPVRHRGADAVRPQGRLAVAAGDPGQEGLAAAGQVHAPVRRPGQPPADGLVGRVGQQPHAATRRRSTAASTSSRPASRSTSRARCC